VPLVRVDGIEGRRRPEELRRALLQDGVVLLAEDDLDVRAVASRPMLGPPVVPAREESAVSNHVYRLSEIVGSSPTSVDDAIRTAVRKAAETVRNLEWFEVQEVRGQVADGDVAYFQVTLKIGFRVED
jgi:flavin-binding protein dodecin